MHAHQHVQTVADVPLHHRDVGLAVDEALVGEDAELVPARSAATPRRRGAPDASVRTRYWIRSEIVIISSLWRLANTASSGTRAIVPSLFAISQMTPAGIEAGDAREIDRSLGLPGTDEHAALARLKREHVPRPRQVRRTRVRIDGGEHGRRAIAGGDPRRRDALGFDGYREGSTEVRRVLRHHLRQVQLRQPLLGHRQADQAAPVRHHEVDGVRRDLLRRDCQVALVLAILVVDDDDHAAVADRLDRLLDGGEGRTAAARGFRGHARVLGCSVAR